MNNKKIKYIAEYLSVTLILSYFLINNIVLVLIGILISLYLINIKFINNLFSYIIKKTSVEHTSPNLNKHDKAIKADAITMKLIEEDSKLTLVEQIEELGFIPSLNKDNN